MLTSTWKKGTSGRLGEVTFKTEAPYSASVRPMEGPAMMRQSSRTRMPESGCSELFKEEHEFVELKEVSGDTSSSWVSVHGGMERRDFPYKFLSVYLEEHTVVVLTCFVLWKSSHFKAVTPACFSLEFMISSSVAVNLLTCFPIMSIHSR